MHYANLLCNPQPALTMQTDTISCETIRTFPTCLRGMNQTCQHTQHTQQAQRAPRFSPATAPQSSRAHVCDAGTPVLPPHRLAKVAPHTFLCRFRVCLAYHGVREVELSILVLPTYLRTYLPTYCDTTQRNVMTGWTHGNAPG